MARDLGGGRRDRRLGGRLRAIRRGIVDLTASDHERLGRAVADPDRFALTRSAEAIGTADAVIVFAEE